MAHEGWHEPYEKLSPRTRDLHRALVSIEEELEAIDWYQQRIDACEDPELARILAHNRDEEKEHASMLLEWVRRRDVKLAATFRMWLFTHGEITRIEEEAKAAGMLGASADANGGSVATAAGMENAP